MYLALDLPVIWRPVLALDVEVRVVRPQTGVS